MRRTDRSNKTHNGYNSLKATDSVKSSFSLNNHQISSAAKSSTENNVSILREHHKSRSTVRSAGNNIEKSNGSQCILKKLSSNLTKNNRVFPSTALASTLSTSNFNGMNQTQTDCGNVFDITRSEANPIKSFENAPSKATDTQLKPSISDGRGSIPNSENLGRLMSSIYNLWRTNANTAEAKKNPYHGVTIKKVR